MKRHIRRILLILVAVSLIHVPIAVHKSTKDTFKKTPKITTKFIKDRIYFIKQMKKIKNYTEEDLIWLTNNIYFEARSENLHGKMVVAFVTMNRVTARRWPDSIKEVVRQKWQFSWYNDRKVPEIKEKNVYNECRRIAEMSLTLYNDMVEAEGFDFDGIAKGADHYFTDYIAPPKWASEMTYLGKVGRHLLYKA